MSYSKAENIKSELYKFRVSDFFPNRSVDLQITDFVGAFYTAGSDNASSGAHRSDLYSCASCTTIADAASQGKFLFSAGYNGNQSVVPSGVGGEFYVAACLQVNYSSSSVARAGLIDVFENDFLLGHRGESSPTNWVFYANSTAIVGPAIVSGTFARLEAVRVAGVTSFYVDGALAGTSANAYFANDAYPGLIMFNNGNATARRVDLDEMVFAMPSRRTSFP